MKRTVVMLGVGGLVLASTALPAEAKPPVTSPTVSFSSASYSAAESAGSVSIVVNRTDSSGKASTVLFTASVEAGDTATAGSDFTVVTSRTLTFKGRRSVTTTVPILPDSVAEPSETFHVTLSSPSSPATLGTPSSATVTITDDDVPAAPSNVHATAVPPDGINLSWDANADYVTGYEVLRSTTSGGSYTSVATPTANSFSDTGLSAGTYYYVVKATNSAGSSTASEEVFATLQPVAGIQNGGFETGDFTGWTAGALAPGTGTSAPLLAGVRASRGGNASRASVTPQQVAVSPPTPVVQDGTVHAGTYAAFLGGSVDNVIPTGASYLYQDVSVPASGQYTLRFYYWPESSGGTMAVGICDPTVPIEQASCGEPMDLTSNAQEWQEGMFSLGTYSGQTVRVVFAVNQSETTGGASMYLDDVTMLAGGPGNLQATAATPGESPPYEIDLSWDATADATDGYHVLRSTTSGGPYTQVATASTNSYADTTVNPATYYCYVVRSVTSGGESLSSNESCAEVVAPRVFNGGFETGDFSGWTAAAVASDPQPAGALSSGRLATTGRTPVRSASSSLAPLLEPVAPPTPVVQDATARSGSYAAFLGGPVGEVTPSGMSVVSTDVTVPSAGAVLAFFYRPQHAPFAVPPMVTVCQAVPPTATAPFAGCLEFVYLPYSDMDSWHQGLLALDSASYGGQTVRVVFAVDQRPDRGSQAYLDDVTLEAPMTLTTPDAPTNLVANSDGPFGMSLSWDAMTGATGYRVYRSSTEGGPYDYLQDTDATSFADSRLAPSTTYYYVVSAFATFVNPGEPLESAKSTEANGTTAPAVATMLDDLEGVTSGWTTTGLVGSQSLSLWHVINDSSCASPAYASPTHAFYYGVDSSCNYVTTEDVEGTPTGVANSGTLTSPAYTIPAGAGAVSFAYTLATECGSTPSCPWDLPTVEASYDDGSTWVQLGGKLRDTPGVWERAYLPISPSGTSLRVRFTFKTGDQVNNHYLGWMIDDLSVYQAGQTSGTFQNSSTIYLPSSGAALTYPSTIAVSGMVGSISDVNVTLNGFTHSAPSDVDALLVGPAGQKVVLFGDAGQDIDVSGVTLTFDDAASGCLPQSSQIVAGTFKSCAAYDGTSFAAPAPASPYGTTLSGFNGTDPNGTWKLFLYDDYAGDYGQFAGGWSLSITTS